MMACDMFGSDGQKSNTFFYWVEIENGADFEFVNTFGYLKRDMKGILTQ